ncbi:MAG: aminotransferase class IV [Blastocatellia bacterium]|nr:aminotransferase class IV [Blastocatellia bacterium]
MHKFVFFNQQIIPASQTKLSAISSATFYGKGIFTSLAIYDSKPFLWEKHWSRLVENATRIGLDFDFSEETVAESLAQIIKHNKIGNGRARLTFFDESAQGIWAIENDKRTSLLMTTGDFRPLSDELKLTVSPYLINSTSPLINVKSCNYLENLLALEETQKRGFDEAVRLNEKGEIVSAAMANIFWIKDDEIFTPSLQTGCLAGTTREFILEKYEVVEVEESIETLHKADAVFLTSAGLGVKQFFFNKNKAKHLKFIDLLPFAT